MRGSPSLLSLSIVKEVPQLVRPEGTPDRPFVPHNHQQQAALADPLARSALPCFIMGSLLTNINLSILDSLTFCSNAMSLVMRFSFIFSLIIHLIFRSVNLVTDLRVMRVNNFWIGESRGCCLIRFNRM